MARPLPHSSISPGLSAPSRRWLAKPQACPGLLPTPNKQPHRRNDSSRATALRCPPPHTAGLWSEEPTGRREARRDTGGAGTHGAQPPGPLPPGQQRALRGFRAQVSSCLSRGGRILGPVRNRGRTEAPLHQSRSAVLPGSPRRPGLLGQLSRGGISSLVLHSWLLGGTWEASGLTLN